MSFRNPEIDKSIIIESQHRIASLIRKHHLSRPQIKFLLVSYTFTEIEYGHWQGSVFVPAENALSRKFIVWLTSQYSISR